MDRKRNNNRVLVRIIEKKIIEIDKIEIDKIEIDKIEIDKIGKRGADRV
jgi:hypothetical protein